MPPTRQIILNAALSCFEANGYEATTTAAICRASKVSNGSFFHHFGSKDGVAAALFLLALRSYHHTLVAGLASNKTAARGIQQLVSSHIKWVTEHRPEARFLFEQSRAEWLGSIQDERQLENNAFADKLENWRQPLIDSGALRDMDPMVFFSQVIGPAQILTRQWLSSQTGNDIHRHSKLLGECAIRALTP